MPRYRAAAGLAATIVIAAAGTALAQAPPTQPARVACRTSAMTLCRDQVRARDRAGVRACLIKSFDKVTPECQAAMKAAQARGMAAPDAPSPKP